MPFDCKNHVSHEVQLNDFISGQTISLSKWIQYELIRIQNNINPRHCQSYGELVQVIEEPFQFQIYKMPTINSSSAALNTISCFFSSCAAQLHSLENIRRSLVMKGAKQPTSINLCRAFFLLFQSYRHAPSPRLLMYEFDKLHMAMKQRKQINSSTFRAKLMNILFGKKQLTKNLIRPWQIICQWMAMVDNNNQWARLSISIFIIAKRLYLKRIMLTVNGSM